MAWANRTEPLSIVLDASPWGIGGYLERSGKIEEYFADRLTGEDAERFQHAIGDAAGQQTWETLAALVALRLWKDRWVDKRVSIKVRGDSVAMLTVVLKLKAAASAALGLIAREIAIDLAESALPPDIRASHLPGVTNTIADSLSRKFSPSSSSTCSWTLPAALTACKDRRPEARDCAFYRTLDRDHPPRQVRSSGMIKKRCVLPCIIHMILVRVLRNPS